MKTDIEIAQEAVMAPDHKMWLTAIGIEADDLELIRQIQS